MRNYRQRVRRFLQWLNESPDGANTLTDPFERDRQLRDYKAFMLARDSTDWTIDGWDKRTSWYQFWWRWLSPTSRRLCYALPIHSSHVMHCSPFSVGAPALGAACMRIITHCCPYWRAATRWTGIQGNSSSEEAMGKGVTFGIILHTFLLLILQNLINILQKNVLMQTVARFQSTVSKPANIGTKNFLSKIPFIVFAK